MPANTAPIFTVTPNVSWVKIPTTYACVKSDGVSAGSGIDIMMLAFTAGANGSYVDFVRFYPSASASVNTVACVLRAFLSTVAAPGATTQADTQLIGEFQVTIQAAGSTTNQAGFFDIPCKFQIPTGTYIHVTQSVAQTTNANWTATVFGGDY
jgi:hypothetical protein